MDKTSDLWLPEAMKPVKTWLCLWVDGNGKYIVNEDYEFLCIETIHKGASHIEKKMRAAAESFGVFDGSPVWREGRRITHMEWDDQMERLMDGKIPDEIEAHYAALEDDYLEESGRGLPRE